jgi:hypothetical protein
MSPTRPLAIARSGDRPKANGEQISCTFTARLRRLIVKNVPGLLPPIATTRRTHSPKRLPLSLLVPPLLISHKTALRAAHSAVLLVGSIPDRFTKVRSHTLCASRSRQVPAVCTRAQTAQRSRSAQNADHNEPTHLGSIVRLSVPSRAPCRQSSRRIERSRRIAVYNRRGCASIPVWGTSR